MPRAPFVYRNHPYPLLRASPSFAATGRISPAQTKSNSDANKMIAPFGSEKSTVATGG
jgi:hypothetical protein